MPLCSYVQQPVNDPDAFRHAQLASLHVPGRLLYEATGIQPGRLPGSGCLPGRLQ